MKKYIQKKLLGRMSCGLLMVTGFVGNMAQGSQGAAVPGQQVLSQGALQAFSAMAGERIPNDPFGDTWYSQAVRTGNLQMVLFFLANLYWNLNMMDRDRNTDLMLAIKGGEQDEWRANYRAIFNLLVQYGNRDWNSQNAKGQTALAVAVGWGRPEAIEALLRIDAVNPNIPNVDNATPLFIAIANTFVPLALRVNMALQLINNPRVNVNQRGPNNKLPLQVAAEAGLLPQLSNPLCRRGLADCDMIVREAIRGLMAQLSPSIHGQALAMLQTLLNDPRVNVNNYFNCPINQLIDAIRRKIHFVLNQLGIDHSDLPRDSVNRLRTVDANAQLYGQYLTRQDPASLGRLSSLKVGF